jgi:hypothetical protein
MNPVSGNVRCLCVIEARQSAGGVASCSRRPEPAPQTFSRHPQERAASFEDRLALLGEFAAQTRRVFFNPVMAERNSAACGDRRTMMRPRDTLLPWYRDPAEPVVSFSRSGDCTSDENARLSDHCGLVHAYLLGFARENRGAIRRVPLSAIRGRARRSRPARLSGAKTALAFEFPRVISHLASSFQNTRYELFTCSFRGVIHPEC